MTNKEYFQQAIGLDRKINSYMKQAEQLRAMAVKISVPVMGDRVQTSRSREAPFIRTVEKIIALEEKIDEQVDALVDLKVELGAVIDALPSSEEQAVLRCHYLCGMGWGEIASELNVHPRTVRRWHDAALAHAVQPENNF